MIEEEQPSARYRPDRPVRFNMIRLVWRVVTVGFLLALVFTTVSPLGLLPADFVDQINQAFSPGSQSGADLFPTSTPRPRPRIGIVAGHWGFDNGAVCADGLTELTINLEIATRVQEQLLLEGFDVDLLQEYDPLLDGYDALALISIHADSCGYINDSATGFKVASSAGTTLANQELGDRLVACLSNRYEQATGLLFHEGSITPDMTSYHAFNEIGSNTTAAIIETGFMFLDRQILTTEQDLIAQGIVDGILCFVRFQSIEQTE